MTSHHVAVLSGGSEIVTAALVEEFPSSGFWSAIIALGWNSTPCSVASELWLHHLCSHPVEYSPSRRVLKPLRSVVGRVAGRGTYA
jgi:hypothetical protein